MSVEEASDTDRLQRFADPLNGSSVLWWRSPTIPSRLTAVSEAREARGWRLEALCGDALSGTFEALADFQSTEHQAGDHQLRASR